MKKILYLNYSVTKECGVYDLGLRHFWSIRDIEDYHFVYVELNSLRQYQDALNECVPDLVIMNYLAGLSPWLQSHVSVCPIVCIPHDMRENDFNIFRRDDLFDYYIILDKNSPESVCGKISKTNRPLKEFENTDYYQNHIPKIGSFGFALTHKNFNLIVREVNKTFDEAEINFHMPKAYYDFENQTNQVINECKIEITKSGIKLNITNKQKDYIKTRLSHSKHTIYINVIPFVNLISNDIDINVDDTTIHINSTFIHMIKLCYKDNQLIKTIFENMINKTRFSYTIGEIDYNLIY